MHRWDRRLQGPRTGVEPVHWSTASSSEEQRLLRSPAWRRTSHGWYVPTSADSTPAQRIVQASATLGPGDAIAGWAAAHWLGSPFMEGIGPDGSPLPVPICVGETSNRRRQPEIEVWRDRMPIDDAVLVGGVRCTTAVRTAFDLARRARSDFDAIAALDTLLECGLITMSGFGAYLDARHGWRGVPRARRAARLALPGVRSPSETKLRLTWLISAGLPAVMVNVPVFSIDGYLIGIPDLLSVEAATVIEYDGADHLNSENQISDARRDARFRIHGLETLRVTRGDLAEDREGVIERLRAAYQAGIYRDASADRWTLDVPAGWNPPA
jgi:Protein of unknown function (DUF559)